MPAVRSLVVAAALAAAAVTPQLAWAQDDNSTSSDSTVSSSQYWHERYHGLLSMAAYSDDPTTICQAQTFTEASLLQSFPNSTEEPWTLIQTWGPTASGLQGYNVIIPEMDKVVMVFRGQYGWESTYNESTADIGTILNLGPTCTNSTTGCTAHAGAVNAYLEAQEATNDWELVKYFVNTTGHQWSVTGHGFGGMVAQVAAIDLGWRGLCHWSHSHGAARVFNPQAANLYNSLFAGQAGQRAVANNDIVPTYIPESENYTFTLQGFHIYGTNATYGMSYTICEDATDPECAGGTNITDHDFYYTPIGECGSPNVQNITAQAEFAASESSAFFATATSTFTFTSATSTYTPSTTSASTSISTSSAPSSTASSTAASAAENAEATTSTSNASTSGAPTTFKAVLGGVVGLAAFAAGMVVLA
ncbi:hypothetical protein JCM21900_005772 [Sporobolomyces salmonicolor]